VKIAVDAMGGDNAPEEIVKGVLAASREIDGEIILVGHQGKVSEFIGRVPSNVSLVHCTEVILNGEKPATALRRKKEASISVATKLVRDGEADAVVSAGSTGAQMAAALLMLGRIPGIHRPAIVAILPGLSSPKLLLDAGANTDCRPENLFEFAVMGSIYAHTIMGVKDPMVGLLNIGSEPGKGNSLTIEAYECLRNSGINFYGNIEARDILTSEASIIVCDGFVGNALLKFGEGLATLFYTLLRDAVGQSAITKLGGICLSPSLKDMKEKLDWEEYGGAPLLGVNKVSIVCHGSSRANAIRSAIKVAEKCVKNDFIKYIAERMKEKKVNEWQ